MPAAGVAGRGWNPVMACVGRASWLVLEQGRRHSVGLAGKGSPPCLRTATYQHIATIKENAHATCCLPAVWQNTLFSTGSVQMGQNDPVRTGGRRAAAAGRKGQETGGRRAVREPGIGRGGGSCCSLRIQPGRKYSTGVFRVVPFWSIGAEIRTNEAGPAAAGAERDAPAPGRHPRPPPRPAHHAQENHPRRRPAPAPHRPGPRRSRKPAAGALAGRSGPAGRCRPSRWTWSIRSTTRRSSSSPRTTRCTSLPRTAGSARWRSSRTPWPSTSPRAAVLYLINGPPTPSPPWTSASASRSTSPARRCAARRTRP